MANIEINIQKSMQTVIKDVKKGFSSITQENITKAASSAINRAVSSARVAGAKEIQKIYNIAPKYLKEKTGTKENRYNAIKVWRANKTSLTGKLLAYGNPLPIIAFPVHQSGKDMVIEVKKGQSKTIRNAFPATMRSGHKGIFARGFYQRGKFIYGQEKQMKSGQIKVPITQIMTTSLRAAIIQPSVLKIMGARAQEQFKKRFEHDLIRLINK